MTKFNPTGSAFLYSTYFGGAGNERSNGVAVDSRNRVYITGLTNSTDFPTVDAVQPMPDSADAEPIDGFSAKLKADGSGLIYSTFLGGKGFDWAAKIAVDARGNAYVCGFTDSGDLPTTPGAVQREYRDPNGDLSTDTFITKIFAPRRHHHDHDEDCEDDNDGEGGHSRKARH